MKKNFIVLLLFAIAFKTCFAQELACNEPTSTIKNDGLFRTYLLSSATLTEGERGLKSSSTYIREVNAKDGRWKLISTSMVLCGLTYGPLIYPAFSSMDSLKDIKKLSFSGFCGYYIPAILVSGAIPFVLTLNNPVKRAPSVAFGGFGVLGFMNGIWIYSLVGYKSIINIKNGDGAVPVAQSGLRTMIISTVGGAIGGYFLAKKLDLSPGEASMITSNGRWMFLNSLMLLGAYLAKDQYPDPSYFSGALFVAGGDTNSVRHYLPLTSDFLKKSAHFLNFMKATPATLVGSSILGCGLGYIATRHQSFTQGDVRIFNNMIFISELTTLAALSATGMYRDRNTLDKALAIQALAYPVGGLLNQFIFGRLDFSNNQSKLVGIETQLFSLFGAIIGRVIANPHRLGTGISVGAAIGANAGFLTYFLGVRHFVERANFSMLKGTSDMGFTLLPQDNNSLAPGVRLTYSFP